MMYKSAWWWLYFITFIVTFYMTLVTWPEGSRYVLTLIGCWTVGSLVGKGVSVIVNKLHTKE